MIRNLLLLLSISTAVLFPSVSNSLDVSMSLKGIKFGMKAGQVAKLGGGDTSQGCHGAIFSNGYLEELEGGHINNKKPWTYGGIAGWTAECMEDQTQSDKIPGVSGLYKIKVRVAGHNTIYRALKKVEIYTVDDLVEIYSKAFGKFDIKKTIVKNRLGQEFIKKTAIAKKKGAIMIIADTLASNHRDNDIRMEIISLDYLKKKAAFNNEKLKRKQSDF